MTRKACFIGLAFSMCLLACLILPATSLAEQKVQSKVERGKYLVKLGGCHDCHSPKVFTPEGVPMPDESRLLSGHPEDEKLPEIGANMTGPGKWILFNEGLTAAVGPWGMTFAANLTPDPQFGIGLWTAKHFIEAMRTGKHMGAGRPILPPMPWFNLTEVSDEDLSAMFAYLKSLPPIKNQVPTPLTPEELAQK
jgi:mono/diheme cytochrome c family protein